MSFTHIFDFPEEGPIVVITDCVTSVVVEAGIMGCVTDEDEDEDEDSDGDVNVGEDVEVEVDEGEDVRGGGGGGGGGVMSTLSTSMKVPLTIFTVKVCC
jgi:hypothetical protein